MPPTAPLPAAADARTLVLGLSLAQLISWGSALYSFAVFVEPVEAALDLTRGQISLAYSVALLAEGLAAFAAGRWIDAGHERAVMTGGSLLVGFGLLAQGEVSTLAGFYAVWVLIGLGMAGTLYPPVFAVVTRRFPHSYRRAIITITFLGGLASTVFIPLSAALIGLWGWRAASWTLGVINLAVCVPLHGWLLRGAPGPVMAASRAPSAAAEQRAALSAHLRGPVFWRLGVFIVLLMAVNAAVPPHLVSLLRESGLPVAWVVALPASIGALQVLGRLVLYAGERRLDVHAANRWTPALIPLALAVLLAGSGHSGAALLFALLYGLGNGLLTIVRGTVMAQYVSAAYVGALNGALGLPLALSRAAAPLAVGLLWTPAHGYAWSLALLLAISVLGVAALWSGQRRAARAA
ncbi:MAG: MFS transporter [Burkholderiaceae bacterium]|jgi:MFS family permease|nr:MFS transporter [Burkholderiaceae bacterium]